MGSVPGADHSRTSDRPRNGYLKLAHLFMATILHFGLASAAPILSELRVDEESKAANDPQLWIYAGTGIALVLLGGAFAGLTIALMGQDEIYLQVIATSGEGSEKKNAAKVLKLLKRGKHWVLVTLLVGNVITNETLPIVLNSIGGGYAAAIASTVLVIVFGEIVPQSICVRFGLPIGAWCANFVLVLMFLFAPITWPIAKLLDKLLGEDHGTTYKKAGLKTLVTLHKTIGGAGSERLNEDEALIISSVLDLKAKSVGSIMTPMNDVFTLSADAVLDEEMMDDIGREGYSRIPIHEPKNRGDFVGMLLVKMLITYDPEDARHVNEFSLATLPETRPETSCLDILNFFQEGKSHMILVSDFPGKTYGALGVVTLEDVIEELIGEEIIDESDVFVDVHKAIRRMHPAPTHRARVRKIEAENGQASGVDKLVDVSDTKEAKAASEDPSLARLKDGANEPLERSKSPKATSFLTRRKSSTASRVEDTDSPQARGHPSEFRQHLKHLGPSNSASRPKSTRVNTVKIKPGVGTIPEGTAVQHNLDVQPRRGSITTPPPTAAQGGIGQDLVNAGKDASDGVQAVQAGYGSLGTTEPWRGRDTNEATATGAASDNENFPHDIRNGNTSMQAVTNSSRLAPPRSASNSTIGSMHSQDGIRRTRSQKRGAARSGSITEQLIESGGVKKLVLEANSSSSDEIEGSKRPKSSRNLASDGSKEEDHVDGERVGPGEVVVDGKGVKRKKRKKRGKKGKGAKDDNGDADGAENGGQDENTPLLERGSK